VLVVLKLLLVACLVWSAFYGRREYRRLLEQSAEERTTAQRGFLSRGSVRKSLMLLASLALLSAGERHLPFQFEHADTSSTLSWCLSSFVLMALTVPIFRRWGDWQLLFLLKCAGGLIPRTARGRKRFIGVAALAGVGEEIIFRWFLTDLFIELFHLDFTYALVASSALFGFAHLYQGVRGVALTGLMGFVFGTIWVDSGTLIVPIFLHFLLDARIPFVLTDARLSELDALARAKAAAAAA
jgi:membrane protease YdiL (CAAX protease family)